MTGNHFTRLHESGGDLKVTSFDRNAPGSGCRRPVSQVLSTLELLQAFNSQEVAVM